MAKQASHPNDQRDIIRDLVAEIEALRAKRRVQWRDRPHAENKTWSQEELRDLAYTSYNHLLRGSTQRLPSRAYVFKIANYLECNNYETNDLLLAAQYMPEMIELRADEEQAALEQGKYLVAIIGLPAVVLRRGWQFHTTNAQICALHQFEKAQLPADACTMLDAHFERSLHAHHMFAYDAAAWPRNAASFVGAFRQVHQPFQREPWYRDLIQRLHTYPDFPQAYAALPDPATGGAGTTQVQTHLLPTPITHRAVVVPLSAAAFPCVVIDVPVDAAAQYVYTQLGCTVSENRWEHALPQRSVA